MTFEEWWNLNYMPIAGGSSAQDIVTKSIARTAWNVGWQRGYNQGKDDPDFEKDEDKDD
jgi:hypothetical protein